MTITPEVKEHLWSALTSLASAPVAERTLTGLVGAAAVERAEAGAAALYASAGPGAGCSTPRAERLGEADVQAFETEGLIGAGAAPAVLAYLFHRIEDRLDGRPTLLIIDEGWLALDDPGFAGAAPRMAEDAAQEECAASSSPPSRSPTSTAAAIAPAIIESCPTRIFLPNERALEPQIAAIYRRFGLNDRQIEILEPRDAQARLLLPVPPRQPPVRARPRRGRARLHRRLLEDRSGRHRRSPRRPWPRRLRRRLAARQGPRLGGGHAHPPARRPPHEPPSPSRARLRQASPR